MRQSPRAVHHVVARAGLTLLVADVQRLGCGTGGSHPANAERDRRHVDAVSGSRCCSHLGCPTGRERRLGGGRPFQRQLSLLLSVQQGSDCVRHGDVGSDNTYVLYGTLADLTQFASNTCRASLRNVTGSFSTLGAGEQAEVGLGWSSTFAAGPGNKSVSVSAQNAAMDLLAVLHRPGAPAARAVIRRDIPSSVMTFDPIDFASAEAFDTEHPSLTITGASGEAITFAQWYRGTNGSRNSLYYGSASVTLPTSYAAIPAARQRPADLHEGWAFSSVTQPSGVVRGRTVTAYWHDAGSRVIALPAVPSSDPSVTVVSSSPFAKLRAQVAVPAGAKSLELFYYRTGANGVSARVQATVDFLSAAAADLTLPDLSSVAGFQSAYLPQGGGPISWGLYAYSWTGSHAGFYGRPLDATNSTLVSWRSTVTP
ncbi:MAG: hypothetical protein IPF47_21530 [Gemmatimonadetes bacterium]|nr:hypothetical protein [Gemmatimonadota bacterium]